MLKAILHTPRNSHEGEQTPQLPWVSSAILHQPYLRIHLGLMHSCNGGILLALGLDVYTRIRWDSPNFLANPMSNKSTFLTAYCAPNQSRLQFLCFYPHLQDKYLFYIPDERSVVEERMEDNSRRSKNRIVRKYLYQ